MREPTLGRSNTLAVTAIWLLKREIIFKFIKEPTLGRIHTLAGNATRLLHKEVLF